MANAKRMRCAVYTRKSNEDGLEQEFNSLHAQREACQAYILSQRHEGWTLVGIHYDDGRYSGGNMERPGLKALLAAAIRQRVHVCVPVRRAVLSGHMCACAPHTGAAGVRGEVRDHAVVLR